MPFDLSAPDATLLTARQQRLLGSFIAYLGARNGHAPDKADFAAFGALARLERLHGALALAAPHWCAECRLAIMEKRAESWQQRRRDVPARPRRPAMLSVPYAGLPQHWQHALDDMRAIRRDLDRGVMSLDDRVPPAPTVIDNLARTLRQLAFAAEAAGTPPALDVAAVRALLAGLEQRGRMPTTKAARLKELLLFAAWLDDGNAATDAMRREKNRQERLAARQAKEKEIWLRKTRMTVADCWLTAEQLLAEGLALPPGTAPGTGCFSTPWRSLSQSTARCGSETFTGSGSASISGVSRAFGHSRSPLRKRPSTMNLVGSGPSSRPSSTLSSSTVVIRSISGRG